MKIQATGNGPCIAKHIGTVKDVIEARIPEELTNQTFNASDFAFGFELATPRELTSLGESVIAGGYCFATSTDKTSPEYNQVISGEEFLVGGVFILPNEAKPSHKVSLLKGASPLPFEAFYQAIVQEVDYPFAFVGFFHFENFHGTAIAKPPIDGKNIFSNKEEYYSNPEIREENIPGFVMGVVTKNTKSLQAGLETVLYQNPFDTKSTLIHHAHVLTLKTPLKQIDELKPNVVDKCLHLFNDGSTVAFLEASVYTIEKVEEFKK
ncbi:MAG: hypothetical protein K940chlam6_01121 [Chlamydiae bacterium]|nr:hypothetical protein [Chlamydiota bacterium]